MYARWAVSKPAALHVQLQQTNLVDDTVAGLRPCVRSPFDCSKHLQGGRNSDCQRQGQLRHCHPGGCCASYPMAPHKTDACMTCAFAYITCSMLVVSIADSAASLSEDSSDSRAGPSRTSRGTPPYHCSKLRLARSMLTCMAQATWAW